jgi:hypothetical protein
MSLKTLPSLALLILTLGVWACDDRKPDTPSAPATPAAPVGAAEPVAEPAGDGGSEQLPDEPLPTDPVNPVASPQPTPPSPPVPVDFAHNEAGSRIPGSGSGYLDRTVWSPDMCFPFEETAYANSQVYGPGGYKGPPGTGQCNTAAYSLPWRDNFCESRGYSSPLCANGKGHQAQDIGPATCTKGVHWVVAAEAGTITDIGTYSVTLTGAAAPHRVYRYLHLQMASLSVAEGSTVAKGGRLGKASNDFGSTPTTIHMHFELRAGVAGVSTDGKPVMVHTFLPPYLSLVESYRRKINGGTCG